MYEVFVRDHLWISEKWSLRELVRLTGSLKRHGGKLESSALKRGFSKKRYMKIRKMDAFTLWGKFDEFARDSLFQAFSGGAKAKATREGKYCECWRRRDRPLSPVSPPFPPTPPPHLATPGDRLVRERKRNLADVLPFVKSHKTHRS